MNCDQVSVIIPVYNVEQYLRQCIDSVIGQTYNALQIILVDDGSTDGSGTICDEYAKKDSRIAVIHKENGGVSSARNAGLSKNAGEFVLFVDADDYIAPDFIQRMVSGIKENNSDICCCGYTSVEGETETRVLDYKVTENTDKENFIVQLFSGTGGTVCSKLFRSGIINDHCLSFSEDYSFCEDQLFALEYFGRAERFCSIDCFGYYYNRGSGVTANTNLDRWLDLFGLWRKMKSVMVETGISSAVIDGCEQSKLTAIIIGLAVAVLQNDNVELKEVFDDKEIKQYVKRVKIRNKTTLLYVLPLRFNLFCLAKAVYSRIT